MRKKTLLLITLTFLCISANGATRYVSENLHTFIHSGAGTKYKIIGSVNAGDKIEILQTNKAAGFTLIRDLKGRKGWINSKYVSQKAGLKERLPKLESKLEKLNIQLNTSKQNIKSSTNELEKLQNTNLTLKEELKQIQALNNDLNSKLDTKQNDLLMRWFTYGGIVGGVGLFLGLIIPLLIPSRRNKKRW